MSQVCVRSARFHFCTVVILACFILLCCRLFFLQVIEAGTIAAEVESARTRLVTLDAKRGDILDRNSDLLAGTRSRIEIGLDPQVVDAAETARLALLAGILDMPYTELQEALGKTERIDSEGNPRQVRWVPLVEVDEDLYASVQELGIRGVYGNRRYERYYPGRELGAHLIGFLNKEATPVMGVELALDYYLRGQPGWLETEVDGLKRELPAFRRREVSPRNGMHVQLTLDLYVQSIIEAAIADLVEEWNPESASIIVSNPKTGDILGLANYPVFDPNAFWEYPLANQRNRAVTDQYEPGSTFKIIPISAALEEGLVDVDTLIECGIERRVYNGVSIPMPNDHRNLGTVPVSTVMAKSSNRGAAQIGMLLGEQRLYGYARTFGFGERTGWPLNGETQGNLKAPADWDGYTISRLPTGYAVGVTPMQIHLAMSALANDGVRMPPRLLKEVIDGQAGISLPLETKESTRILSKETAQTMKQMMVRVVSPDGTARRADIPGYLVAGKTGTTRKLINGQYSPHNHIASFTGCFPAPDPELVITVVIDDAKTEGPAYGGLVAAPVFRSIGEKLIPHMAIRKPEEWTAFIVSND